MPNQLTFLGASVTSINASLGFGGEPSQLEVGLVEDLKSGDNFSAPSIGVPLYFLYGSFSFGGICQNWNKTRDTSGDPLYSVVMVDPRAVLEGVQLIIDGYTGSTFSVPNLYNIYGYLENIAYGNSGVNESGMEYNKIRDTFLTLQNTTPINFAGYEYYLDLTNLPNIPAYYRIGAENISMMDFIAEICDAAACDFYFKLSLNVLGRNIITLYTISRASQPILGYINQFISQQGQFVRADTGFELRNETASKFLVGGNIALNFFQFPNTEDGDLISDDNTIWQYFGTDEQGDVIVSSGLYNNDCTFTLPSRGVNVAGVGDTYKTDIAELRAALAGQSEWEFLLRIFNDDPDSVHYQKMQRLGMYDTVTARSELFTGKDITTLESLTPLELMNLYGDTLKKAGDSLVSYHEENINRMYEYIHTYASDYLGKKFMVRVPFVTAKRGDGLDEIVTSLEPTDGGFIEEIYFSGAVSNNLMSEDINWSTLEDGRTICYVKFPDRQVNGKSYLDLSELSLDDYRIGPNCVFVKGTLQRELQFLDRSLAYSPRAIVELPGKVTYKEDDALSKRYDGLIEFAINQIIRIKALDGVTVTPDQALQIFRNLTRRFGGEITFLGIDGMPIGVNMACVPLKSNVDFYGPWYAIGEYGKVDFQVDSDLVPWNYGGYALMNLAAQAKVTESLSNFLVGEAGSIELVGAPIIDMGAQLVANGPYVTDIKIGRGPQGITTTYRMQIWTPRFGKVGKTWIERQKKNNLRDQKYRRIFREQAKLPPPGSPLFDIRRSTFTRGHRMEGHTSNMAVCSEIIEGANSTFKANVVFSPPDNIINHIGESGYDYKVVNSLDALFRPFTTDTSATTWSHLEDMNSIPTGTDREKGATVHTLNPFTSTSDFILYNKDYPTDAQHLKDADGSIRGTSIRGPAVVTGWGYDIFGFPIPNDNATDFITNYEQRMDRWKTGPVDLRWNPCTKTWTKPGPLKGYVQDSIIQPGSNGTIIIERDLTATGYGSFGIETEYGYIFNYPIRQNTYCVIDWFPSDNKWRVIQTEPSGYIQGIYVAF